MVDVCFQRWYQARNVLHCEVISWIQQLKTDDFKVDNAETEFQNQPPLLTNVPDNIRQYIFDTVDADLFINKFFKRKVLYTFFVLRYDPANQPSLDIHNDVHDKIQISNY